MTRISAQSFFQSWCQTVGDKKEMLLSIWQDWSKFTDEIRSRTIGTVAKKLGLKCYSSDYYSMDALLYADDDLVPGLPQNTYWFRGARVAFEHENKCNNELYQEVAHLLMLNCDLRVLVTYPGNDDGEAALAQMHKLIKEGRQSQTISDDESFLIILGYETDFAWQGFVYKTDNWKEI